MVTNSPANVVNGAPRLPSSADEGALHDALEFARITGLIRQLLRQGNPSLRERFHQVIEQALPPHKRAGAISLPPLGVLALGALSQQAQMGVSQLATAMSISVKAASALAIELSELGLVKREEDPLDRRRTLLSLDVIDGPVIEAMQETWAPLAKALANLSPKQVKTLFELLGRIAGDVAEGTQRIR